MVYLLTAFMPNLRLVAGVVIDFLRKSGKGVMFIDFVENLGG